LIVLIERYACQCVDMIFLAKSGDFSGTLVTSGRMRSDVS
jgi:hypothetical protein